MSNRISIVLTLEAISIKMSNIS